MSTRRHNTTSVRRVARPIRRSQRNWSWAVMLGLATLAACVGTAEAIDLRSWDRKINNAHARFELLQGFNDEAVLDKETQLVWERSPDASTPLWDTAIFTCFGKDVGGRKGWRLPKIAELASLVDPTVSPGPTLPRGHPFVLDETVLKFWSATVVPSIPTEVFVVRFGDGFVDTDPKDVIARGWCVRGGQGVDSQ